MPLSITDQGRISLDILEAIRRVVVDLLIGNGDNRLKNWSFRFAEPAQVRLSPAYDIVPTIFFQPGGTLALRVVRTYSFDSVNLHRFERVAGFLQVDPRWIVREVAATVERALDIWPAAAPELLGEKRSDMLLSRLDTLRLVQEARA